MKRVIALLLVLSVCLVVLSACSNSSQEDARTDATDSSDVTDVNRAETETTVETIPAIVNVELVQTQLQGKCDISEGNTYIVEISNYTEAMAFGWAIVIDVGEDFDASSITYLNGSSKYLEEKNISMSCRLEGNQLIVVPDGWYYTENVMSFSDENTAATNENAAIDVNDKMYLLVTSDMLSEEITFTANLYGYNSENGIYEIDTDASTLRKATGEVVLQYCNGSFSEGFCWMEIEYEDTDERKNAIIDKTGNIIAEFDVDLFSSCGDFYNGVSLVTTKDGLYQYVNAQGEIVFSSDDEEYANLIEDPESLFVDVRNSSYVEVGYWPAFNMPTIVSSSVIKTIRSQSHLCTLQYSEGAMLLQLNGKDGIDYYTLIDKQGNSIVEPTPGEAIGTIGNGRFVIQVDGVYHILNEKGEEIFINLIAEDSEYQAIDSVGEFHDGLAQFRVHCKSGYFETIFVDTDGNVVFWLGETIVREITEVGA